MLNNCKVIVILKCTMYFTICKAVERQNQSTIEREVYFILLAVICRETRPPTKTKKIACAITADAIKIIIMQTIN